MKNLTLIALLTIIAAAGLVACDRTSQEKAEDAAEQAGEKMERAYDGALGTGEDLLDEAENALDEIEYDIQDRVDD